MRKLLQTFIIIFGLFSTTSFGQESLMSKYNLMPWPQKVEETTHVHKITPDFTISVNQKEGRAYNYATNFLRRLSNRTGVFIDKGFPSVNHKEASLIIEFNEVVDLSINTDNSYQIISNQNSITIKSNTDVGAIRGLETLLQSVDFNEEGFFFHGLNITDAPRFKWRGLMIDVSRHFHPVEVIKRNLNALAAMKMNVFHWHLTDDQGYRIESKVYPKLHTIGGDGLYYSHEQIKDVVNHANNLGIRVIPEIDVPGHATAILSAYPEYGSKDTTYTVERFSGIFDPTLNPTLDKTYEFLDTLFKEVSALFPDEYFHIGGDENEGKHWDANKNIQAFKKKHHLKTNHDLQTYFNIKLEVILRKYGKKLVGWDEIMTPDMPKSAVIHSWRGENEGLGKGGTLIEAAKKGYQTILSNGFYIDRMTSVEGHYLIEPVGDAKLTPAEEARILGGEVTMWSELVTPLSIDSRIWPRTAAIAERFWSAKSVNDLALMKKRLQPISYQLEEVGITHIRNKEVILRNITQQQKTTPINILVDIFEPLKIYTRNEGGTEYKTYSPFTLFADVCNVDAPDAIVFNKAVKENNKEEIIYFLKKWRKGYQKFLKLNKTPYLKAITPHYKTLDKVAEIAQAKLQGIAINKEDLSNELELLNTPLLDTELMILESLKTLLKN